MSRLWPSIRVALTPGQVSVADGRALRESVVKTPGWEGALITLKELLSGHAWKGGVSVRLSHHFSSVHVLTPPPVLLKPAEMHSWIHDCLARQFGEQDRDWKIAWQPEPPGKSFVAASMSASALEELQELIQSLALKPGAVQPWLVSGWNRNRRRFGKAKAWYALIEPGRLMLAGVAEGNIHSVRAVPIHEDPSSELADLIRREALLNGDADNAEVWIDSVRVSIDRQRIGDGLTVRLLAPAGESMASMLEE